MAWLHRLLNTFRRGRVQRDIDRVAELNACASLCLVSADTFAPQLVGSRVRAAFIPAARATFVQPMRALGEE